MATLTIRDVDDTTRDGLKALAGANGRSMSAEVRRILEDAVKPVGKAAQDKPETGAEWLRRVRADFAEIGYVDLPEVDRHPIREPDVNFD